MRLPILIFIIFLSVSPAFSAPPKNVILLIGDGMGPEQVKAAGMYANGNADTLNFGISAYNHEFGRMGYLAAHAILRDIAVRKDRQGRIHCPGRVIDRGKIGRPSKEGIGDR